MASDKILKRKQIVIDEVSDLIDNHTALVLFDYRGLTDEECKELRCELRKEDHNYKVFKNTLMKRSFDSKSINLDTALEGPSALAYGNEVTIVKTLSKFAKKHPKMELKLGYIDGKVADLEELKTLALLPTREEALAMLGGALVGTLKNLAIGLDLVIKQKENN